MSQIDRVFEQLERAPTPETVETVATQLETLTKMLPRDDMKDGLIKNMGRILKERKFNQIRKDESMLRLYQILAKYSDNLKGSGIYKQLLKKAFFNNSLKFYILWAEECGKEKMLKDFKEVLKLACDALSSRSSVEDIEAGFRDLADEHFPGEELFSSADNLDPTSKKSKRRSSVCFLQRIAPNSQTGFEAFGPKTRTKIRREFIDSESAHGISIEEYRYAQWKDTFNDDVTAPITVAPSRQEVENRPKNNRRRQLSPLTEGNGDDEEEEKRSRIYSPVVPTKDAHRPPLRDSMLAQNNVSATTRSSEIKKDAIYNNEDSQNDKSKQFSARKSGLDLMAENEQFEAHAMFSDTVRLDRSLQKTHIVSNQLPERPKSVTTDFSVLCDPDPTITIASQEEQPMKSTGLNMVYDEQSPFQEEEEENETIKAEQPEPTAFVNPTIRISPKSLKTPTTLDNLEMLHGEEDFLSGLNKPSRGMVVTSTPAPNVPFVNIDDYFGNKNQKMEEEEEKATAPPAFVVPSSSTLNKMMRRKSQAASARPPLVTSPPAPAPPKIANSSIVSLSENLGRGLSIEGDKVEKPTIDDAEITGCKNRRRSEIIQKGEINPWDETLRKKLMGLVRPPMNMHEFPERAPRLYALRGCEVGGEVLHIQTLIGQGGYAKVYRAVTEEKKTVAVKYEVPSCAWEVYICDQMRNRLLKDRDNEKMADMCIMRVIDAYVFSTASLLVNEYHEYGTLLEYANNMKDPNWHVTCFLVTQMARILKEIHACKIIHGDIKPDNFMITRKIESNWERDALMSNESFVIKLIDWGRAIDMMPLKGHSFKGRAGTEGFDTPEMLDGRPWNFQTDYYGFAASMAVVVTGKYATLAGEEIGSYTLNMDIKRRNVLRDTIIEITNQFLNIPSCDAFPDWNDTIQSLEAFWNNNFDVSAWRQAVIKFNEACDLSAAVYK